MRVAGIMSGTSLDGIDVAIADISGRRGETVLETVAHSTVSYMDALRARILAVSNAQCTTGDISRLNFELGELYARAVKATCGKAGVPLTSIELVGCHGQTIFHEGSRSRGRTPSTLQIGEASVLAERLGIPVVSNFRARDMAAGGQGAPLVPFLDNLLFRHPKRARVALNIGGIANITVLPAGTSPENVIAFDTGPGNMVIDQLVSRMTGGRRRFDRGGTLASRGHVDRGRLDELMRDPYFRSKPPKSTGREQFGAAFVEKLTASNATSSDTPFEDLIATATAFTAASIAYGIQRFAPDTREVIASGGGVHNRQLMAQFAAMLPEVRILTTADFGVDVDAKEAIAFAVLAWRTWRGETGNLPGATGASQAAVLGAITPAGAERRSSSRMAG